MYDFITTSELAARLRVAPHTVARWAGAGQIPAIKITPRTYRFRWEDVLRSLDHIPEPQDEKKAKQ